jgi:hypothetical protein
VTYDEYEAISEDILFDLLEGNISELEYEEQVESLAEQWDEEGEE